MGKGIVGSSDGTAKRLDVGGYDSIDSLDIYIP
jgi:hypothetical protein